MSGEKTVQDMARATQKTQKNAADDETKYPPIWEKNGRKDFEWAVAWGIVKGQLILIPLIIVCVWVFMVCAGIGLTQ